MTGFLGSGKTTFLRYLSENNPGKHLLFLVNEFSKIGIDDFALTSSKRPVHAVVGGSLFCECKSGDFIRIMRDEVVPLHKANPLHAVVIETSGIADPQAIGRLMTQSGLSTHFVVQRIVCITSPLRFPKLHAHMPAVKAQIQTSDLIAINKTDLATPAQIESAQQLIRSSNPSATVITSQHCRFDFDFFDHRPTLPSAPLATCDANPFTTDHFTTTRILSHEDLLQWLQHAPPEILRIKGYVSTNRGDFQIQQTVDSCQLIPADRPASSQVVLVAHDDHQALLDRVAAQLRDLPGSEPS